MRDGYYMVEGVDRYAMVTDPRVVRVVGSAIADPWGPSFRSMPAEADFKWLGPVGVVPVSPGQAAYEAFAATLTGSLDPWDALTDALQTRWEGVAASSTPPEPF